LPSHTPGCALALALQLASVLTVANATAIEKKKFSSNLSASETSEATVMSELSLDTAAAAANGDD